MLMSMSVKGHIAYVSPDIDLINDKDNALFFQEHFRMDNIPFLGIEKLSAMILVLHSEFFY